MLIRLLLPPLALLAGAGPALAWQRATPSESAKAFTLDGMAQPAPTPDPTPTPASAEPRPAAAPTLSTPVLPESAGVAAPTRPAAVRAVFTLDTPIEDLIADPGAKAVLDKDLPGMSSDENLDKFKAMTLRQLQPQTGGQLTDTLLAKVASDLDVLGGGTGQAAIPRPLPKAGDSKRNSDASR